LIHDGCDGRQTWPHPAANRGTAATGSRGVWIKKNWAFSALGAPPCRGIGIAKILESDKLSLEIW
jgi:hypothetical protein